MEEVSRAVVLEEPGRLNIQEFVLPVIGPDDALLRVELAGVCGTDGKYFSGHLSAPYPIILGHEILGEITEIGAHAAERYQIRPGDRVLVDSSLPCWACHECRLGQYRFCRGKRVYGTRTSVTVAPHLWGAMAEYMYVAPGSIIYKIGRRIPGATAIAGLLLANGIEWLRSHGNVTLGDDVVIQGCGPQGLAAVVIAKESGARRIIVTGLGKDAARLELARRLGATEVVVADQEDVINRVTEATAGRMADVVLDVSGNVSATGISIQLARPTGVVVLAGLAGKDATLPMKIDHLVWNEIRLQGAYVKGEAAYAKALDFIETRASGYPIDQIVSHTYPLERAEEAIRAAAGQAAPENFIKAAIAPWSR